MEKDLTAWISELLVRGNEAKVTSAQVKERFDREDPSAYGLHISSWLPDHDYVHDLLCDLLMRFLPSEARILDLGGGTGRVAKLLLKRSSSCRVVVQDISANMLSEVPKTLREFPGRFECLEADFFAERFDFEPNSFDGVVSVHAIHHGRRVEMYRQLYHGICRWLKPGGCFVCLDNVAGGALELAALSYRSWAESLSARHDEETVRSIVEMTILEDSPLSLGEHLRILGDCGFSETDVVWKKYIFGLYVALKRRAAS